MIERNQKYLKSLLERENEQKNKINEIQQNINQQNELINKFSKDLKPQTDPYNYFVPIEDVLYGARSQLSDLINAQYFNADLLEQTTSELEDNDYSALDRISEVLNSDPEYIQSLNKFQDGIKRGKINEQQYSSYVKILQSSLLRKKYLQDPLIEYAFTRKIINKLNIPQIDKTEKVEIKNAVEPTPIATSETETKQLNVSEPTVVFTAPKQNTLVDNKKSEPTKKHKNKKTKSPAQQRQQKKEKSAQEELEALKINEEEQQVLADYISKAVDIKLNPKLNDVIQQIKLNHIVDTDKVIPDIVFVKKSVAIMYKTLTKIADAHIRNKDTQRKLALLNEPLTSQLLEIIRENDNLLLFEIFKKYYSDITSEPQLLDQDVTASTMQRTLLFGKFQKIGYSQSFSNEQEMEFDTISESVITNRIRDEIRHFIRKYLEISKKEVPGNETYNISDIEHSFGTKIGRERFSDLLRSGLIKRPGKPKAANIQYSVEEVTLAYVISQNKDLNTKEIGSILSNIIKNEIENLKESKKSI